MTMPDLTEAQFGTLKDAMTIAKGGSTTSKEQLKGHLLRAGHSETDADAAIAYWSAYEQGKPRPTKRD